MLADRGFKPTIGGSVVHLRDTEIILHADAVRTIVWVLVLPCVRCERGSVIRSPHGAALRLIDDGEWNRHSASIARVVHRFPNCARSGVRFRGNREERHALRKNELRFGHANAFNGLPTCHSGLQCARIGVADVFAREDRKSPTNEARVLA